MDKGWGAEAGQGEGESGRSSGTLTGQQKAVPVGGRRGEPAKTQQLGAHFRRTASRLGQFSTGPSPAGPGKAGPWKEATTRSTLQSERPLTPRPAGPWAGPWDPASRRRPLVSPGGQREPTLGLAAAHSELGSGPGRRRPAAPPSRFPQPGVWPQPTGVLHQSQVGGPGSGGPRCPWAWPATSFCRNLGLIPSLPCLLRPSPLDPRPFLGHPFRLPWEARAASTGLGVTQSPPLGPRKDTPSLILAGPPASRSSCLWRGPQPCRAAPCARRSSAPGWPSWTWTATSHSAWQKARMMWHGEPPVSRAELRKGGPGLAVLTDLPLCS
ncbi:Fanconi anemia core complex-associated protein 20 isoform X1 [Ictidomys tridecemlineatus]